MNCDVIRNLLEEYALGTLGEEERQRVKQHIESCPNCLTTLSEIEVVLAALPGTLAQASPLQPRDSLKAELLQKLAQPPGAQPRRQLQTGALTTTIRNGRLANEAPRSLRPMRAFGNRLRLALVAATLLCVLAMVWGIRLNVALARERALRVEFSNLVDQQEIVLEVIDSSETTKRVLRAVQPDSTAYGKVFTRMGMPHVVAMAARLEPPSSGHAYHLWVTLKGATKLAGLLKVNDEGFGLLIFDESVDDPVYERAWITLQPIGTETPVDGPVIQWSQDQ